MVQQTFREFRGIPYDFWVKPSCESREIPPDHWVRPIFDVGGISYDNDN